MSMICPTCSHVETQVKDSRPMDEGKYIKRRRVCNKCKYTWNTLETDETYYFKLENSYKNFKLNRNLANTQEELAKLGSILEKILENTKEEAA